MKKLIILIILVLISTQNSFALNSSPGEMEYKKKKALAWYNSDSQFHGQNAPKEISLLKEKAMKWYGSRATSFSNEMNSSKKKALKWHEKNNK